MKKNDFTRFFAKYIFDVLHFILPEKQYLKVRYRLTMGKRLDLDNPKTMNEKLQWLKLYDRRPEYTQMVDKVLVKDYVASIIGGDYIIPTLGVWNHFDEIDFDSLPNKFVLKTNHSGGGSGVIVCKDKNCFDKKEAKRKLERSLKKDDYAKAFGEWPYKNVKRKILAEQYLGDELNDYKFYCFDGRADVVLMCIERKTGEPKFYFFDREWNLRRYNKRGQAAPPDFTLPKPEGMDVMFEFAEKLSAGIPFARIDLYYQNGNIYFGEITLYPASGYDYNRLPEADLYFGNMINLPKIER